MAHNCRLGVRTVHLRALRSPRLTPIVRAGARDNARQNRFNRSPARGKNRTDRRADVPARFARATATRIGASRPLAGRQDGRGQNISRPGMKIISPGMS